MKRPIMPAMITLIDILLGRSCEVLVLVCWLLWNQKKIIIITFHILLVVIIYVMHHLTM